jgi:hypothetical protein
VRIETPGRLLAIGLLVLGPAGPVESDSHDRERWGPFAGRVVDVDTGQPVAGAVMLVVWTEAFGVGLFDTRFYEAKEAVSDADGHWEIPRLEADRIRVTVLWPTFHMFAAGYRLRTNEITPPGGAAYVADTVTTMKRLTTRAELLGKSRDRPSIVPLEKLPAYTTEINKERTMLGFTPLPVLR